MLDIGSLSMELWVAQVSYIHKNILKERNRMNADSYVAGKFKNNLYPPLSLPQVGSGQ